MFRVRVGEGLGLDQRFILGLLIWELSWNFIWKNGKNKSKK